MSTVSVRTARKERPCGNYPCANSIERGDVYVRHVAFPGDDGHEEGTRPWVIDECSACVDTGLSYVADRYDVPARLGARITFEGEPAVILGRSGAGLLVRLGDDRVVPIHPTWRVEYEEASQ